MQENGIGKFSRGGMPPNPHSLLGANHSCKILDPPLLAFRRRKGQAETPEGKTRLTGQVYDWDGNFVRLYRYLSRLVSSLRTTSMGSIPLRKYYSGS